MISVENIDRDAIRSAVDQLNGSGIAEVALVEASAGADAILDLSSRDPGLAGPVLDAMLARLRHFAPQ